MKNLAGGMLLVGAGVWLLCQVLKGNALARLGLVDSPCGGS
jgi:hypothetical protein